MCTCKVDMIKMVYYTTKYKCSYIEGPHSPNTQNVQPQVPDRQYIHLTLSILRTIFVFKILRPPPVTKHEQNAL